MASSEEEWEGTFAADGVTPEDAIVQKSGAIDVHHPDESDAVGSGAEDASTAEISLSKRTNGKSASRKRGRRVVQTHDGDSDFESQPSITKWFRQVPGPLHDVMKKQHLDHQQSMDDDGLMASGRSSGHIVHISTVFDTGAWVEMCNSLGMTTSPGQLYGGIKISSLKHTIAYIHEDDQLTKIPQLLVLIKSMRYVDEEIVGVFHDPSGESIEGYFHRDIVEQVGPALVNGTGVVLRKVSIFMPSDSAVGGASHRFLNITPRNVRAIYPATTVATVMESIVRTFNQSQAELIQADEEAEKEAVDNESLAEARQRALPAADVRTTTTELSFISQRQVVQRHQPVRLDPNEAEASNSTTSGKQKKKETQDVSSGLGRWQWHTLAQKKPATNDGQEDATTEPRRPFPASGRFTQLLSQHIQARRAAAANTRPSQQNTTVNQQHVNTTHQDVPAKSVRFTTIQETTIDEDDDDDDW